MGYGPELWNRQSWNSYQSRSMAKLLILKGFKFCMFFGQSDKALDFQGLRSTIDELSTKLSTDARDDC
ncbi:MAG: hypothetical protein AUJ20_14465 [Comamonadaceae bacterium CG1_02_60_18]|nr:MAG: hypothetical protein AUJ20_14465 [Comamonadaceae bacterium CG1_02_60_18]PIQ55103.1 MAG: hypothetical protein COW02_03650 [Comamonadaceae bacterium CG12_big_fil_rev_8_21_14_0_65_59_15]